jgi:hypothetical protein
MQTPEDDEHGEPFAHANVTREIKPERGSNILP